MDQKLNGLKGYFKPKSQEKPKLDTNFSSLNQFSGYQNENQFKLIQQDYIRVQKGNIKEKLKIGWTPQQQFELYQLHKKIGNKWALIAKMLPGRSDNCLKNYFYSKLRKSLRMLNRMIQTIYRRQFHPIQLSAIYKVMEVNDQRHKQRLNIKIQQLNKCQELLYSLLKYSTQEQNYEYEVRNKTGYHLIRNLTIFNGKYKKKPRRRMDQGEEQFIPHQYIRKETKQTCQERSQESKQEANDIIQNLSLKTSKKISSIAQMSPLFIERKFSIRSELQLIDEENNKNQDIMHRFGIIQDYNEMPLLLLKKSFSKFSLKSGRHSENSFNWDLMDESSLDGKNFTINNLVYEYLHQN